MIFRPWGHRFKSIWRFLSEMCQIAFSQSTTESESHITTSVCKVALLGSVLERTWKWVSLENKWLLLSPLRRRVALSSLTKVIFRAVWVRLQFIYHCQACGGGKGNLSLRQPGFYKSWWSTNIHLLFFLDILIAILKVFHFKSLKKFTLCKDEGIPTSQDTEHLSFWVPPAAHVTLSSQQELNKNSPLNWIVQRPLSQKFWLC